MTATVQRPRGLTDAEAVFAEAYLTGKTPSEAAKAAGMEGRGTPLRVWGSRALKRPRVKKYMDDLRALVGKEALARPAVVMPVAVVSDVYEQVATAADVLQKLTAYIHSDIGDVLELVDDFGSVDAEGKPLKVAVISLEKAIANGKTHLIDEVEIGKDGKIRVKFVRKMDAINALIRVLGMEKASESDKAKERASVAAALSNLPPEVLEALAKHSLGPARPPVER